MKNVKRDLQAEPERDAEGNATTLCRYLQIERRTDEKSKATTYRASLSSETPIKDYSWAPPHVLVHSKAAVDLSRAAPNGLPLLRDHDRAQIIGRVMNLQIIDRRLVGDLVFSQATAVARESQALVDEGTLTDMSVSIKIERVNRIEEDGDVKSIEVLRWCPLEASIVSVPADHSVGIGRARHEDTAGSTVPPAKGATAQETDPMFRRAEGVMLLDPDPAKAAGGGGGGETAEQKAARENTERLQRAQAQSGDAVVQELERQRVAAIENLGKTNNLSSDIVRTMVSKGMNMEEVSQTILKIHEERGKRKPPSRAFLDLPEGDVKDYSIVRAINAQVSNRWQQDAPFELECSQEVAKRLGKIPEHNRFFVPLDIQRRHAPVDVDRLAARIGLSDQDAIAHLRRDLNVATTTQGGFLTQTSIISFDELLRNISFAYRMGVRRLSGLRDTVAIPRQSAAATAVWLANETSTITESTPAFVQLLMAPKQVGAYTEISRQLLMQSVIEVESFLQQDLAAVVGLAVDAAVLNGSGASGQPTGLDNTSGVGSVTGTTLAFDDILEFQTDVAAGNVRPVRGGYVTTPAVASLCIQRVKYASTASPLWEGNIWEGQMQGFPAMSTNQVAAATMYFGDWDKAVVGEWGVLEIETNPFANFQAAIIGVRAIYSIDVGIRYPVAFSRAGTIT